VSRLPWRSHSFSIVGPGLASVVVSTNPIRSDGPISQEAIRWNTLGPPPFACNFENLGSANNSITDPAVKIGAPHVSNCILNFNLP
jgi:hypothetical protein